MTAVAPAPGVGVTDPVAPAPHARVAAALAIVVALVGAVLGPTGRLDGLLGPTSVTVVAGTVERQVDGGWEPVAEGRTVGDDEVLRAPDGVATLGVRDGTLDLAAGTQVVTGRVLQVDAGSVVVASTATTVRGGSALATGPGTWRWDASGRVGAYDGSVVVTDASDREVLVRSLEQVALRDGLVAEDPRPYAYRADDDFDRRHLAPAIGVDDYLGALRAGLSADFGTAPQDPGFYTDFDGLDGGLVAALGDVGFDRVAERIGPPADVLVAAVVTDALVVTAGLEPTVAADEARTARLAGATWGLVAQARDLDAGDVRAAAERALARRQQAEQQGTATPVVAAATPTAAAPPGPDAVGPDAPSGGEAPDPTAPPTTGGGDDPGTGGAGDPGATPPPGDDGDDTSGPVGTVVEETGATDLLGEEVGGLVDDVVGSVDDVLDGPEDDDSPTTDVPTSGATEGDGLLDATGDVVQGTVDTLEGVTGSLLGN